MAHRPRKKTEFFNKGRCRSSPIQDDRSCSSLPDDNSLNNNNHDILTKEISPQTSRANPLSYPSENNTLFRGSREDANAHAAFNNNFTRVDDASSHQNNEFDSNFGQHQTRELKGRSPSFSNHREKFCDDHQNNFSNPTDKPRRASFDSYHVPHSQQTSFNSVSYTHHNSNQNLSPDNSRHPNNKNQEAIEITDDDDIEIVAECLIKKSQTPRRRYTDITSHSRKTTYSHLSVMPQPDYRQSAPRYDAVQSHNDRSYRPNNQSIPRNHYDHFNGGISHRRPFDDRIPYNGAPNYNNSERSMVPYVPLRYNNLLNSPSSSSGIKHNRPNPLPLPARALTYDEAPSGPSSLMPHLPPSNGAYHDSRTIDTSRQASRSSHSSSYIPLSRMKSPDGTSFRERMLPQSGSRVNFNHPYDLISAPRRSAFVCVAKNAEQRLPPAHSAVSPPTAIHSAPADNLMPVIYPSVPAPADVHPVTAGVHPATAGGFPPVGQNFPSSASRTYPNDRPASLPEQLSPSTNPSPDESLSANDKKRLQTCRLCHNHNIVTPIRGHKYVCPFNKCDCKDCKVTLRRRHFVKEQLKITRRQNTSLSDTSPIAAAGSGKPDENVEMKPFPQKEVMVKDLELFDDMELFEEIDSICRPQSKDKSS